ncbi:MAG: hypothetical protein E7350_03420 [Clostridiales bacterium]|nr:hypothetical protein [Clostridiales bacterium]
MKIFEIGKLDQKLYPEVGGKARGLDFLARHGNLIADGFIVTDIDKVGDDELAGIYGAFDRLNAERVSVRSSASREDGGDFSSAGQYETCLDVKRDGLIKAVDRCLASLSGDRAKAYSQNLSGESSAKMNLVVERMIDASFAGVMFSTDPMNGDNVLIEAVCGKGEELVSGASSAYRYSLPKSGFVYDGEEGLSEAQLRQIYTEGNKIAAEYGSPADLEWVIDQSGKLYWLQLRPITAVDDASLDEFNPTHSLDNHLLTTRNIGEMMPGSITPLSISTSVLAIDYGMRNMLRMVGAFKRKESAPDYYMALAVKYHLFIDMSSLYRISRRVMLATCDAMNLSVMGEYYEDYPRPEGKNAFFLTKVINGIKFAKYLFSSKKAKKRIVELGDGLVFEATGDVKSVYDEITKKLQVMNDTLCCHYVCSSFSGSMNSALAVVLANVFERKTDYQVFISKLLSDIDGIESADILCSLSKIGAAIIKHDVDAVKLSDQQLLALVEDQQNTEINELYKEFLAKHGHRSIKEAELRSKPWKNDRISLIKNIRTVMLGGEIKEDDKKPFDLEELLLEIPKSKRKAIRWIGTRARRAVRDREFTKSNMIKVIDKFKDRYAYLARLLVDKGYLADEDSIYFLSHDEIGQLIGGSATLKRKAIKRRVAFYESEELTFSDINLGTPQPLELPKGEAGDSIKGIPVCRGKVYGRARVVKSQYDAQKIQKDEIMVAPFTDIGWSPYYSLVRALITEVGSTLSHGAVVAREYCLPTVVNAKNATRLIKTGDYLCVDASHGNIHIISEEEFLAKTSA